MLEADQEPPTDGARQLISIEACSHQGFPITNLTIHSELVGATHSFEHQGKRVHVSVPSPFSRIQTRRENREQIYAGSYWVGEEHNPLEYLVGLVHVRVEAGEPLNIPGAALEHPPIRLELFKESEQQRLTKLLRRLSGIGNGAFAYWLRIMRWKTGVVSIGAAQPVDHSFDGSPDMECLATHRRFWLAGGGGIVPATEMVSCEQWAETQEALNKQEMPPLWLEFWFDGEHRIRKGDLTGAILSLAIALETAVRRLVVIHLSDKSIESIIYDTIDNSNISFIMNKFRSLSFWDKDWDRHCDHEKLRSLIQRRNDIMHVAKIGDLTESLLQDYSRVVKKFIYKVARFMNVV
jgi:hypothetical protein